MQAQEILNDVRRELVETVAAFFTDAELLSWLNRGEKDFVNKTRILEGKQTLSTSTGKMNYPLPSNWLSAKGVTYDDKSGTVSNIIRLRPTNLEKMLQERPNFRDLSTTDKYGTPRKYFVWGREIWLDKAPNQVTTVELWFKAKPTPITQATQDINIDDSLSDALFHFVLWKAWSKEKEFDLAAQAQAEYEKYVRQGLRFVKKQSGDQAYQFDIESGMPMTGNEQSFLI